MNYLEIGKNIKVIKKERINILLDMSCSEKIFTQGGVTLYEALSTGREIICMPTNSSQFKLIKNLTNYCNFIVINNFKKIRKNLLEKKIKSQINTNVIDGHGAKRIINYILGEESAPTLKKIREHDYLSLYSLRKDPLVQKNSISKSDFNFDNHKKFIKEKLQSNSSIYIYRHKENFIGQVRLDKKRDKLEIDYGINPLYRNKGHSFMMLKKIMSKKTYLKKNFVARVKRTNKYSNRNFRKLGFELISQNKKLNIFSKNA